MGTLKLAYKTNTIKMQTDLNRIPEGYSLGYYLGNPYGITKTRFNQGKSLKLYAEELGGSDFISLNYYCTTKGVHLKPCEMPKAKVVHFLNHLEIKKE